MANSDMIKDFIIYLYRKYNHALILLYYYVVYKWFAYLESTVKPEYIMFSRLDLHIPFIKEFVVPYVLWFGYIAVAMIYLGLVSRGDFIKLSVFMFTGMTICFIVYMVFPNGQNLRPEITGQDFFSNLIRTIYTGDTPTNSAPSIHVINSIAVHLGLANCEKLKDRLHVKAASFTLMLLIIMSTVFIKQHSILDVVYGVLVSMVLYVLIYGINNRTLFNFSKLEVDGQ